MKSILKQIFNYFILVVMVIVGFYLYIENPNLPFLTGILTIVPDNKWAIVLGIYLISIILTNLIIYHIWKTLHKWLKLSTDNTLEDRLAPLLVGLCESIIYPTLLVVNQLGFIGGWIAIKVAGGWIRWSGEEQKCPQQQNEARRRYNRFLVCSVLQIIFAVITWAFLKKLVPLP